MITSKQKKIAVPLLIFTISLSGYIAALGSLWFLLFSIPMGVSGTYLCFQAGCLIGPKIQAWLNRDGWK